MEHGPRTSEMTMSQVLYMVCPVVLSYSEKCTQLRVSTPRLTCLRPQLQESLAEAAGVIDDVPAGHKGSLLPRRCFR